jgi:DNA-binding MarR family transcriptional regulator
MSSIATRTASCVLIAQLARSTRRRFEQAIDSPGPRPHQLLVLYHLRERGPSPQQALIELLGVDPSNVVAVLNDLEDGGLIVRRRDRADRRRGIIELSADGEALLKKVDRTLDRIDDEMLSGLTADQRATLNALLTIAAEGAGGSCAQEPGPSC